MYNIILDNIQIEKNKVFYNISYSKELNFYFKSNQLFFEYEEDMSNVPISILSIPFIATFWGISWMENCNIYVPELDETYYYSLREVRAAYQDMYYKTRLMGRVVPCKIVRNKIPLSEKALLLFGGGVDAHASYIRNKEQISEIINIQGWYNQFTDIDEAANADKRHCEEFAKRMNIQFNYIRCNFASIINSKYFNQKYRKILGDEWWHGIQHSVAFISIAIVMAYKHNISNIIIGSSCTIGQIKPCNSYITTDSAFKFALNGNVVHDAFELNRQQKVAVIVNYQKKVQNPYPLKVCSFKDRNCCTCEKCFRTMIEIIAENGDVRNFGFPIEESLISFFPKMLDKHIGLWGIDFERTIYWKDTFVRMEENYQNLNEKDFVDWILKYDFDKSHHKSLRNYYRQNFFSILKRKLKIG